MRLTATTKYIFWLAVWCEEEIGKHTYYDLLLASLNKSSILSHCVKENSSNEKYFGKHPEYYKVLIGKTFVLVPTEQKLFQLFWLGLSRFIAVWFYSDFHFFKSYNVLPRKKLFPIDIQRKVSFFLAYVKINIIELRLNSNTYWKSCVNEFQYD